MVRCVSAAKGAVVLYTHMALPPSAFLSRFHRNFYGKAEKIQK